MQGPATLKSVAFKLAALVLMLGAGFATYIYPLEGFLLAALLVPYAGLLLWRPALWLLLLPILLPIFDIAPWTGWFYLEEIDLILLVTAAVGYWRINASQRHAALPASTAWLLVMLTLAYLIGTALGLGTALTLDANSFTDYFSRFNSLRVGKGFFWVIVLLPLLLRDAGEGLVNIQRYFIPGVLIGLTLACSAAVWERIMFPGLLNMSSDYRITAPFSAMHTGGAALDGYLALTLPFVAAWLLEERSLMRLAAGAVVLLLGLYVGLTTFSRGVYLAYGIAIGIFVMVAFVRATRRNDFSFRRSGLMLVAFLVTAYALVEVFASSGYRGLAASLALLAAAFFLGVRESRLSEYLISLPIVLILGALSLLFGGASGGAYLDGFKGVYGMFVMSVMVFAGGALLLTIRSAMPRALAVIVSVSAFFWMAFNAVLVAQHWGGNKALDGIGFLIAVTFGLLVLNQIGPARFWTINPPSIRFAFVCSALFALVIPISSSYYMSERFSTIQGDLDYRVAHWREAVAMMTPGLTTNLFGMGLGRYPDTYFWNNHLHEVTATHIYREEDRNAFLRLGAPVYAAGYGEVIRMLQRVTVTPDTPYVFSVDVRRADPKVSVEFQVCKRWLLYPESCIPMAVKLVDSDGQWHHYQATFTSGTLGTGSWLMRAPIQLEMSVGGQKTFIDLDNVSLVDQRSRTEQIRNGSFSKTNDGWFFSSDRHHLPWHIKNLLLNVYFELGGFGLTAFSLLVLGVLARLLRDAVAGWVMAETGLASLIGFACVGLFDSLLDVPRVALLFYLILLVSVLQPSIAMSVKRQRRKRSVASSMTPAFAKAPIS